MNFSLILALWLGLNLGATLLADDQHVYYVTEDDRTFVDETGRHSRSPESIRDAKSAADSRPAELDPDGNWGIIAEGFQLGIRFEKRVFTNGDPIVATVVVRNVSNEPRSYSVFTPQEIALGIAIVRDVDRDTILRRVEEQATNDFQRRLTRLVGKSPAFSVGVGAQRKHVLRLDQIYNLDRPGKYFINSRLGIPTLDKSAVRSVTTGNAMIELLDATIGPKKSAGTTLKGYGRFSPDSVSKVEITEESPARSVSTDNKRPTNTVSNKPNESNPPYDGAPQATSQVPDPSDVGTSLETPRSYLRDSFVVVVIVLLGALAWWFTRRKNSV